MGPLAGAQIDEFVERGWTILRGAFPPSVADSVVDALTAKCGCALRDPRAWTQSSIWLRETFTGSPWMDAVTPRLEAALDQLVGTRPRERYTEMGWWPVRFPGFANPEYGEGRGEGTGRAPRVMRRRG